MHPLLADTRRLLDDAVAGLDPAAAAVRPAAGKWSVAEIVEHLALAYEGTVKGMERVLDTGVPRATPPSPTQRLFKLIIVNLGYFPTGREAPKHVVPQGVTLEEALARAGAGLERLDLVLDAAAARFGSSQKLVNHPILGAFSVQDWRRFHRIHTRHHTRQVRGGRS
ncbi:MAG: DinB family protein [Vicinamibacterales bacterium]|nr:DinB family protein [Vicinamibacterales bacterium]